MEPQAPREVRVLTWPHSGPRAVISGSLPWEYYGFPDKKDSSTVSFPGVGVGERPSHGMARRETRSG